MPRQRRARTVAALLACAFMLIVSGGVGSPPATAQAESPPAVDPLTAVVPKPGSWRPGDGTTRLPRTTRMDVDARTAGDWTVVPGMTRESDPAVFHRTLATVARHAARDVETATKLRMPVTVTPGRHSASVQVALDHGLVGELGPDGYRLEIGSSVRITATTAGGVYYGTRSLIQLLRAAGDGRALPRGVLVDSPDTELRMNTIDVSREYWSPREVTDVIRQMGYLKQNFLVLHLDDAEGFRLDSPRWPGLAERGYSYDRRTIEKLDRIAAENNVSLVPSFEFPAHVSPKSAYFHVGMADGPREVAPGFGERDTGATPDNSCTGYSYSHLDDDFTFNLMNDKALKMSKELLDEFLPWFSSPWVHLGGDELPPDMAKCPALQRFIEQSPEYANVSDVAIDFLNTLDTQVNAAGRRSIVYDGSEGSTEQVKLDRDVVVMDWTGDGTAPHLADYDLIVADSKLFYAVPARGIRPKEEQIARTWQPPTSGKVLGWGMHVWGDDLGWAEGQWLESLTWRPRATVADRQWNTSPRSAQEFSTFGSRLAATGKAPGYTGTLLPRPTDTGRPVHDYAMDPAFPPGTYDAHTATNRRGLRDVCGLSGMTPLNVRTTTVRDPQEGWTKQVDAGGYWLGAASLPGPWTLTTRVRLDGKATFLSDIDRTTTIELGPGDVTVTHDGATSSFGHGVPAGRWSDIALTSDGHTITLYVDGKATGEVPSTAPLPRARLMGTAQPLMGLAALSLYAEGLSPDAIRSARTAPPKARCASYDAPAQLPSVHPELSR
ncbi:family 20 glycosylhydrolase [Streptomyces endophyticus]|uniref:beta-N-acetylhexosaminidase n=1 Tax=Streptomyces endophyticus TaxID=714166 RepID=A0ABU6FA66_9ACTN|nr:family 20 glycosylhydrolase [Streptomyces endophyticus]MEB8340714.1 family 20 glycosylhydrolase [Streptomyces endophyticus]